MKTIQSFTAVILLIAAVLFGTTACHNNCKKDGQCEKASCCQKEACCDKCSDKCTADNKCCDKCKVGEEKSCCKKDSAGTGMKKECCKKSATDGEKAAAAYSCPMHKDVTSDKPGKCSKCNMDLEKQ